MRDYSNYYASFKDTVLESGKVIFEQQLLGFEGKDVLIDGIEERVLIQYHTNPMNEEKEDRKLTCWNNVNIKRGSLVRIIEEDDDYIVITKVKHNDMIKYTKILGCNNTLTWQDEDTLKIHTLPCVLTDKTSVYSDGLSKGKYMILADDQIMITVPNNELTNKISTNKRFMFNHDGDYVYEVSKIDKLIQRGLINITMKHDLYDKNVDNIELNIANYVEPVEENPELEPEDPVETSITIEIKGASKINMITRPQYFATVYDNGVEIDKEIEFELSNDLAIIKTQEDNKCDVLANFDFRTGNIILKAHLVEDKRIFAEKTIKVVE